MGVEPREMNYLELDVLEKLEEFSHGISAKKIKEFYQLKLGDSAQGTGIIHLTQGTRTSPI